MSSRLPAIELSGAPLAVGHSHSRTAYYPGFDWLRAALAITVMLKHDQVIQWVHAGNFAVQVFFALSGWLIGGVLLNLNAHQLARFYFNRAARIWIPYYIAFALLIAASLLHDQVTWKWGEFIAYKATMVYNWFGPPQLAHFRHEMPLQGTGNHYWSVNAEEQFYLMAPLLLVVAQARGRSVLLWIGIAYAAWLSNIYSAIVFGVLAAVVVHRFGDVHRTPAAQAMLLVAGVSTAVLMTTPDLYWSLSPICGLCIVLLLAVPGRQGRLGSVAGGMSYPLYLNHWIGVFTAHAVLKPFGMRDSAAGHMLSFVLNIAIAVGLYWWVDRRLLAARGQLFTSKRGSLITALAYAMVGIGLAFGLLISH
jgi:peptidoglycan/LPS O-acetylase OafA/YrhL